MFVLALPLLYLPELKESFGFWGMGLALACLLLTGVGAALWFHHRYWCHMQRYKRYAVR